MTNVPAYTLRYWEHEFSQLRPMRRVSKQRRYTKEDIASINKIKKLLHEKGFSIAGAKKEMVREKRQSNSQLEMPILFNTSAIADNITAIVSELSEIRKMLDKNI